MHFYLMFLLIVAFIVLVVYFAKTAVLDFEQRADEDVFRVKESYLAIIRQKEELAQEKHRLQEEAGRIFDRYDLMREITKTFDEEEAFQKFKEHLYRQIRIDDCRLVEGFPEDVEDFSSLKGYQFFPLKAKKMVLGQLAYAGVAPEHEETFGVLAHQFALALRRVRLYKELEDLAITDSLTQLHTRRHLLDRFHDEFGRARLRGLALSFLMIDVDHFKRINDEHGHLAGDQVLREVGHLVTESTREIDICGRYGGEEFCVMLPDTDKAGALLVAERIRLAIDDKKIKAYDAFLHISVSIGVATFPEDAHQIEELIDKADWALYRAKKMGRNRSVGFSIYADEKTP